MITFNKFLGRLFPRTVVQVSWSKKDLWHVDQHESRDLFVQYIYIGKVISGKDDGMSGYMFTVFKLKMMIGWVGSEWEIER